MIKPAFPALILSLSIAQAGTIDAGRTDGLNAHDIPAKPRLIILADMGNEPDEETYGDFHLYTEAKDYWTDSGDGAVYNDDFAAVYRWRQAIQNNCQSRFDWCVKPFAEANHAPVAAINGDKSDSIIHVTAAPGETLTFDATASSDPDGGHLMASWYFYPEAGTYAGDLTREEPTLKPEYSMTVPADAAGSEIHLIFELTDFIDEPDPFDPPSLEKSLVPLTDYRRIVINVQ